ALNVAFGALGLVGAGFLALVFGGVAGIVGLTSAHGDPDGAAIAIPIIGITGMALVAFLLLLSIPSVLIGIGLLKRRPWARVAGIVVSIIGMMFIPFGTILGVYGLWVLFSKETERLFGPQSLTTS